MAPAPGACILGTPRVPENVDASPVADRPLPNTVEYAASMVPAAAVAPGESLESLLESIEFVEP